MLAEDRDAFISHHRSGSDSDDVLLSRRRPRLKPWMYWALVGVLVAADFMFFRGLWRDIEEATSWLSA